VADNRPSSPRGGGKFLYGMSVVLVLVGIGGFGTASSGSVTMFGLSMEAKYAYFIYFVLGALALWSGLEARRRGHPK